MDELGRLDQPQSIDRLQVLVVLDGLEGKLLLVLDCPARHESGGLDVRQPDDGPERVALILLLLLIVEVKGELGGVDGVVLVDA